MNPTYQKKMKKMGTLTSEFRQKDGQVGVCRGRLVRLDEAKMRKFNKIKIFDKKGVAHR